MASQRSSPFGRVPRRKPHPAQNPSRCLRAPQLPRASCLEREHGVIQEQWEFHPGSPCIPQKERTRSQGTYRHSRLYFACSFTLHSRVKYEITRRLTWLATDDSRCPKVAETGTDPGRVRSASVTAASDRLLCLRLFWRRLLLRDSPRPGAVSHLLSRWEYPCECACARLLSRRVWSYTARRTLSDT